MKKILSLLIFIAACCASCAQQTDMSQYMPKLKNGEVAPDFSLPLYDGGKKVSLSDFKGKYVLLDFWASWCGDCRREMPIMEEALKDYAGKIEVLSVSFDKKKEALKDYLKEHPANYPVLCDYSAWKESSVTKAYQLGWIPTFFIIAPDGKIAGSGIDGKGLKDELARIFASTGNKLPFESDTFVTDKGRNVTISFIKHGTLMIDIDGSIVHIDPVLMFGTDYSALPKADLLLVTHEHKDHFDMDAIKAVSKDGMRFLSNGRVAEMSEKSEVMQIGQTVTAANNFTITATAAYNNSPGKEQFHPKGRDVGFVLEIDDLKIYVAGDTEDIQEMKQLKDIDIAFLPVNQPFTMTPEQCINAVNMFSPKIVYPYHYGNTDLTPIVEHFKNNEKVDVRIRQLQ